jgi:hypothetical protein
MIITKQQICIILIVLFTACGKKTKEDNEVAIDSVKIDTNTILKDTTNKIVDSVTNSDIATYFIIVTDTSKDYSTLNKKMFELSNRLEIPIDTMGRYYNKKKNLIMLPENDEDEVYAGAYFPRRFPSRNLSLEYLNTYKKTSNDKTIALVAGIYEKEKSADSALIVLKRNNKNALKLKSEIYIGCTH